MCLFMLFFILKYHDTWQVPRYSSIMIEIKSYACILKSEMPDGSTRKMPNDTLLHIRCPRFALSQKVVVFYI
jgi:hypothetical protein